jgi:hypothetical protein
VEGVVSAVQRGKELKVAELAAVITQTHRDTVGPTVTHCVDI